MGRLYLIGIAILVGCATTTRVSDTVPIVNQNIKQQERPKVIRINPNIRMSIRDQIKWYERLENMDSYEKLKTFRMLRDGMFKTEEQLRKLDMIYPRPSKENII